MKLHTYINKYNIVQKKMATDLDVTEGYLSGIVNGKRTPSPDLAREIEKYCNYEVSRLELLYPDEDWPSVMPEIQPAKFPETKETNLKPTAIVSLPKRDQVLNIIRGVK